MIIASDITTQISKRLEDTEENYYSVDDNIIPAINDAIEWIVSVITPQLKTGGYNEELFKEISRVLIYQSSKLGRVSVSSEEIDTPGVWSVTSIYPKPYTIIQNSPFLNTLPYYNQIYKSIGIQVKNGPQITKYINWEDYSEPTGGIEGRVVPGPIAVPMEAHQSVFRPEMALAKADAIAEKMPYDSLAGGWNKFEAGNKKNAELFGRWGYSAEKKFTTHMGGGYKLNYDGELEIFPKVGIMIVGVNIIETPTLLTTDDDLDETNIMLPDVLKSSLIAKTLSIIAADDGDTTRYQISEQEVIRLISSAI